MIYSVANPPEIGKPGGVYLLNSDQIPEEDQLLILCVAHVALIAARGSLRQQVVSPMEPTSYPPRLLVDKKIQEEPSKPLPFMELPTSMVWVGLRPMGVNMSSIWALTARPPHLGSMSLPIRNLAQWSQKLV